MKYDIWQRICFEYFIIIFHHALCKVLIWYAKSFQKELEWDLSVWRHRRLLWKYLLDLYLWHQCNGSWRKRNGMRWLFEIDQCGLLLKKRHAFQFRSLGTDIIVFPAKRHLIFHFYIADFFAFWLKKCEKVEKKMVD